MHLFLNCFGSSESNKYLEVFQVSPPTFDEEELKEQDEVLEHDDEESKEYKGRVGRRSQ